MKKQTTYTIEHDGIVLSFSNIKNYLSTIDFSDLNAGCAETMEKGKRYHIKLSLTIEELPNQE